MLKAGSTHKSGLPLALLIGCALLMRALLPGGWMPSTQGGFSFVLCSGWATTHETVAVAQAAYQAEMAERLAPAGKDGDRTAAPDQPCTFSGLATPWIGADEAPVLILPAPLALFLFVRELLAVGRGLAAPPPPSTGPPVLI